MSGALRVRVGGQWVDVLGGTVPANASWVINPAEAGVRSGNTTQARFGNANLANKNIGFIAPVEGNNHIISSYGQPTALYALNSGGSGYDFIANLGYPSSVLNGWALGPMPANSGYTALWINGYPAGGDHVLRSSVSTTILNARTTGGLQIGSADVLLWDANAVIAYKRTTISTAPPTESWVYAQLEIAAPNNGTNFARTTFHNYYAPQMRVASTIGEKFQFITETGGAYCPVEASAFVVASALALKTDVRSLHPERERIVVRHDPRSDEAPPADIMALRPVTFRPKDTVLIGIDDDGNRIPEPPESVLAIEKARKRLGLIADEVQHIIPSAVSHDINGDPTGIDYAQITVALLDHVQRLTEEVATLRYRVAELEGTAA